MRGLHVLSEDPLDARSWPVLQPVEQLAVPGQRGSKNRCLGGSCRETLGGEEDLTFPCSEHLEHFVK